MAVSREDEFPIEITRVVDGDGFEARVLDGSGRTIEVRLYAIDAPEGAQKYGEEATNHLRKEVEGGRFWLKVKDTDPHGRTVAVVYKDTYDTVHTLNYLMVRAGWAYWYSNYDTENSFGLREAEIAAYLDGNGVWQEPELELPWNFKRRMLQGAEEEARQERAQREAEREEERRKGPTNAYALKMNALLKENKYDLVITESTAFIKRNPHLIRPYQFRAQAYLKVGKYDLAIYDYQAALRKSPGNGELQRLLNVAIRESRSGAISC